MLVKKLAAVVLAVGVVGTVTAVFAEDDNTEPRGKTIVERLDNLGKTIFGGVFPPEKPKVKEPVDKSKSKDLTEFAEKAKKKSPTENRVSKDAVSPKVELPSARSKPALTASTEDTYAVPPSVAKQSSKAYSSSDSTARFPAALAKPSGDPDFTPENTPSVISRSSDGTPKPTRRPVADTALSEMDDSAVDRVMKPAAIEPTRKPLSDGRTESIGMPAEVPHANKQASRPMHERLSSVRKSVFGNESSSEATPPPAVETGREFSTPPVHPNEPEASVSKPAPHVVVAQRTKPEFVLDQSQSSVASGAPETTTSASETPAVTSPAIPKAMKRAASLREPAVSNAGSSGNDSGMLMTRKGPVLSVETLGPRRISVGKESTYEVGMVNSGDVAADDMVVFVSLPEWAEVAGAEVSNGSAEANVSRPEPGILQWRLGHLDAKGRERLTLRVVPRQSRPFDLGVRWNYKPVASQAAIEVQEAKLALQLEGPREVIYGKKESYRLKLLNVGSGAAENVALMMMPIGGGENVPATHKIGVLPAGEEKVLDVELTARQAGNLMIQVDAKADSGAHAELSEKVVVRRAGLKIDVEGPKVQFVGAAVSYGIRIRNPGNAPAKNVRMTVALPAGAKYLSGIAGSRIDSTGSKIEWTVDSISPEVEQMFAVKCALGAAGVGRVQVSAAAEDDLTASADTMTRVDAVANLIMDVKDPEGPVAVGDEVTYEVRVRNRGTKAASDVEVLAYFSRGIEPTGTEGGQSRLGPGQVAFQPIPLLAPGAEVVYKVRAKAEGPGNHIFRAEAHCKSLGSRLVSEATNLYYSDSSAVQTAQDSTGEGGPAGPGSGAMRKDTRALQSQLTPVAPRK